jgi:hypothetical protein
LTNINFAKPTEEQKTADKERGKYKKKEQIHKVEDINILFENFFGPKNVWGPIADALGKSITQNTCPLGRVGV